MGKFSVEVYCGKLCAEGGVIAFVDGSSGTYPPTFASKSAIERRNYGQKARRSPTLLRPSRCPRNPS